MGMASAGCGDSASFCISELETTLTCSAENLLCQVKSKKEKAGASLPGGSKRNQEWPILSPAAVRSSTTLPMTPPIAAPSRLPPARCSQGKETEKQDFGGSPSQHIHLCYREQKSGKSNQENTTVASKRDFTEDNLECKLSVLFCGNY